MARLRISWKKWRQVIISVVVTFLGFVQWDRDHMGQKYPTFLKIADFASAGGLTALGVDGLRRGMNTISKSQTKVEKEEDSE